MPLPAALPPLAWTALRVGALAAVAVYASQRGRSQPKDAGHEHILDTLPEGVDGFAHRAEAERGLHGTGRFRRIVRLGSDGPGVEIDAAGLLRLRLRRV